MSFCADLASLLVGKSGMTSELVGLNCIYVGSSYQRGSFFCFLRITS